MSDRARNRWTLLGPAFVAAIAYVDPGNVAANMTAGATFGYLLVWVLVAANLMAVIVQYLSARLGLVTGSSLPAILGSRLPRPARIAYWLQAEAVAMATDLAEVIGGAIALNLLFGLPLIVGGVVMGVTSILLLIIRRRYGAGRFELVIVGFLIVITAGFTLGIVVSPVSWSSAAGGLVPRLQGAESVLLAASMLGATIMPHAVYLHSQLAVDRHGARAPSGLKRLLSATRLDVAASLAVAGSVNIAMLLIAAASLSGVPGTDSIDGAFHALSRSLGDPIGIAFAIGLLASGLASTSVGVEAGSVIMDGLLHRRIPPLVRQAVTVVPALVLLAAGAEPTRALVISQVLLSLGLPFALIPLVRLTSSRAVMGDWVNPIALTAAGWLVAAAVTALNLALVFLTFW